PCPEVESQRGAWKGTPLHEAINRNDVDAVRDRLTATTLKERDSFGNTPLIAALTPSAALEPAGVVKADTARARIQAEQSARLTIVSALLAKGASVNERGAEGVTPLTQLAGWGFSPAADRRLTDQFLRLGADVNARDDFGSTALMLAASRGKAGLVKLLLSQGADPAAKNCRGDTAASLAQVGGYRAVARVLSTYAPRPR
ncbi:MAG: ankyrin repeat domain-containing protein, partial [Thermoanaerobaculia bacterium]